MRLRPGDVVILSSDLPITQEVSDRLKRGLVGVFPKNVKVVVMGDGLRIGMLRPPPKEKRR